MRTVGMGKDMKNRKKTKTEKKNGQTILRMVYVS